MIISTIQRNIDGTIGFMSDFWTITTATEQAGYPASNLLTSDLNQKWVSWGQHASHNWIEAESDIRDSYRQIYIAGLFGLDRTNPSHIEVGLPSPNQYRMIIDSEYPIASRRRPPVETVSLTNLTGTAATLNGPLDPPSLIPAGYASTRMNAIDNLAPTMLIASFANYNATERPLKATDHKIRIHYVNSNHTDLIPVLETKMRYAGATVGSALVEQNVEQTSEGWIFEYLFNPSSLPGLTGRIGIQVTGSPGGTGTPVPIGVEWIAELQGWGTDGLSWDSIRTIDYPQIVEYPEKASVDPEILEDIPYEILNSSTVYVYLELSDWIQTIEFSTVPLGGFEDKAFYAGRLVIAEGLSIDLKEVGGYQRRKVSDVNMLRTRGGTLRGSRNALHWDEHDFDASIQSQSVLATELESFFENAGMRNPVVLVPDENEPGQAIYGVLTRWEAGDVGAQIPPGGTAEDAEPYYDLSLSAIDARARKTSVR